MRLFVRISCPQKINNVVKGGFLVIEIEKPKIECVANSDDNTYGKFVIEPLERGYGITLGNSLRRIFFLHYLV